MREHLRSIGDAPRFCAEPTGDIALQRSDRRIGCRLNPRAAAARCARRRHRHLGARGRRRLPHRQTHEDSRRALGEAHRHALGVTGEEIRRRPFRCPMAGRAMVLKFRGLRRQRRHDFGVLLGRAQDGSVFTARRARIESDGKSHPGATERRVGPREIRDRHADGRKILDDGERGLALAARPAHGEALNAVAGRGTGTPALARQHAILERVVARAAHRRTRWRPLSSHCRST